MTEKQFFERLDAMLGAKKGASFKRAKTFIEQVEHSMKHGKNAAKELKKSVSKASTAQ